MTRRPPVYYRQPRARVGPHFSIPESDRGGASKPASGWHFRIAERGITLQRVPIHPRGPQAVRVREPDYVTEGWRILDARRAEYADGCAAGAVAVVCGLILFGLVVAAMTSTTAFAVALFVAGLVGATLIGLWAVSRR